MFHVDVGEGACASDVPRRTVSGELKGMAEADDTRLITVHMEREKRATYHHATRDVAAAQCEGTGSRRAEQSRKGEQRPGCTKRQQSGNAPLFLPPHRQQGKNAFIRSETRLKSRIVTRFRMHLSRLCSQSRQVTRRRRFACPERRWVGVVDDAGMNPAAAPRVVQ